MTKQEYLAQIDRVIAKGPYHADWNSLSDRKTPDWYYKGKFGIFIHWGVYSVPAFGNEWYSRNMYVEGSKEFNHHVETYGSQKDFGYKDFIPMFDGKQFDPAEWIRLFKRAGARFIMPVAEHHDGFAMYATDFNRWNAAEMGPRRNVIGELKEASEKNGIVFCASSHRAEHFFFMNGGRTFNSDVNDPAYTDFYGPAVYDERYAGDSVHVNSADPDVWGAPEEYLEDWLCRTCELIDRYQPKILYFDWWIHNRTFKPYLKKLAAYYYNRAAEWGAEVTIDYKHHAYPPTAATYDVERGSISGIAQRPWQSDTAIGVNSWGYTKDNLFKTTYEVLTTLIDVVSKNGMLLLNVGPKPDGTITEEETKVLLETGEWLALNGEGIYDTVPWRFCQEGEHQPSAGVLNEEAVAYDESDFRFTCKNNIAYAFQMKAPLGTEVLIRSFHRDRYGPCVKSVKMLGKDVVSGFFADENGLHISLSESVSDDFPVCYKIELD